MKKVCPFLLALPLLHGGLSGHAQAPALTAGEIMRRVAVNQDSAENARASYVYVQHARVASRKGDKVMCEEITDSRVTPTDSGSEQHLLTLQGKVLVKGNYVRYTELPERKKEVFHASSEEPPQTPAKDLVEKDKDDDLNIGLGDDDTDRDLVENMRKHMVNDTSKDGIGAGLFPLTSKIQGDYDFVLKGRQKMNGRDVYHLEFHPKDKTDFAWKGEAYVDTEAFQPVVVRTVLSRKIPLGVRMLLGTNVPGLGFSVTYAAQPDGIWFPASFGTEFKIHVLFFFRRDILISAENRDFEKTHVKSRVLNAKDGTEVKHEPEKP